MKMTKLTVFLAAFVWSFSLLNAQTYNSPESIEFDPNDGKYFVGNNGSGTIVKLSVDGTLQNFATGISSGPHGLELIDDTLYVCDGANVKMINRISGATIGTIAIGATFLNGATHKGTNLFVTDFSGKKVYRINVLTRQFNLFTTTVKTPNGIIYDDIDDRLVFCCWGSNAPINAISLSDSTVSTIGTTTLSNCDGIAMNCAGDFYVSNWGQNGVRKFNHTVTTNSAFMTGLSSPADIYYNRLHDTLYVPNSGTGNNVSKKGDISCLVSVNELAPAQLPVIFPNPANDKISFTSVKFTGPMEVLIMDLRGKAVLKQTISSPDQYIDISSLASGIYTLMLRSADPKASAIEPTLYKLIKE